MNKKQLVIIWGMGSVIFFELSILMSLIYFSRLPFFIFIFIVALKLLSFFLIGVIALLLGLIMFGINLEVTIESWKNHLRETAKFFGGSLAVTFIMIVICILLGFLIVLMLKRLYYLPTVKETLNLIREWIASQFY